MLYDAFGKASNLKRGWGYSALVEYGGRRVLFDTGAKAADLAYNVDALGIDLKKLDFVVISHRHNDHTAGLHYVLRENPGVTIYTPVEGAAFDVATAPAFMNLIKRYVASVPDELRYFGGTPPSEIRYEVTLGRRPLRSDHGNDRSAAWHVPLLDTFGDAGNKGDE